MTNIDLIKSFKQTKVNLPSVSSLGNCASIAMIKASIEVFGLNNIFDYEKVGNVYKVVLKDGTKLSFTESELSRSNEVIGFELNIHDTNKLQLFQSIYAYACLCMCVMTKRVMEIGEAGDGIGDFEAALMALNDGANTPSLPEKLGLQNYFTSPGFHNKSNIGMMGWLNGHTVYMSNKYYDNYGTPQKIKAFNKYFRRMRITNI